MNLKTPDTYAVVVLADALEPGTAPIQVAYFDEVDARWNLELVLMDSKGRDLKRYVIGTPGGVVKAPHETEKARYRFHRRRNSGA